MMLDSLRPPDALYLAVQQVFQAKYIIAATVSDFQETHTPG
jgi:hypothetical protein